MSFVIILNLNWNYCQRDALRKETEDLVSEKQQETHAAALMRRYHQIVFWIFNMWAAMASSINASYKSLNSPAQHETHTTNNHSISGQTAKAGPQRPQNWPAEQSQNVEKMIASSLKFVFLY